MALAVVLVLPARPADAESVIRRTGSAVGGFFKRVGRILRPAPLDPNLGSSLDSYAKGAYFTTYRASLRLASSADRRLGDEAHLLAGLAAADAGLRDEAAAQLRGVLDAEPVSPYYAVALATLLDLDARFDNERAAAKEAAESLADFWDHPRSRRQADIKAVFLESGEISPHSHPRFDLSAHHDREARLPDRPTERALYLCGIALLSEKEFEKALVCLDPLMPKSLYFPYARYAAAQAAYGLQRYDQALEAFAQVHASADRSPAELFLKDRAALAAAQLLHEADEGSAAISWLRRVRKSGPYGLHAALLSAEVQADQEKPALALIYLQERPATPGEPKMAARAAALDAELHRDLGDSATAAARLDEGLKILTGYAGKLAAVSDAPLALDRLAKPLQRIERRRALAQAWRRKGVAFGVPDLLDGRQGPGWAARLFTSALENRDDGQDVPIIFYPKAYDPFDPGMPLKLPPVATSADPAFPTLFRHSLSLAVGETFRHERELDGALAGKDDTQLTFLLLDTVLRLRDAALAAGMAPTPDDETLAALGFGDDVLAAYARGDARPDVLLKALRSSDDAPADAFDRPSTLRRVAQALLGRWREHRRTLVREAVAAESKAVQELRFVLDFELSQTLGDKKEAEKKALQGS